MGLIKANLPDELERAFRHKVIERIGGKKGDLQKAVQEAIKDWIDKKKPI